METRDVTARHGVLRGVVAFSCALAFMAWTDRAEASPATTTPEQGYDLGEVQSPRALAMGGALNALGTSTTLVEAIRAGVDRYAHPEAAASVAVVPGHFGGRAEIMGALALAISRAADLA